MNWFVPLMIGAPWGSNKTRFLLIFFIYVLTVCWNSSNFDDTLMVTIYQIGQSAGNQIEIESLRDYTLVIASTNLISIEKIEKNNCIHYNCLHFKLRFIGNILAYLLQVNFIVKFGGCLT